jgi:hypothetical protein
MSDRAGTIKSVKTTFGILIYNRLAGILPVNWTESICAEGADIKWYGDKKLYFEQFFVAIQLSIYER